MGSSEDFRENHSRFFLLMPSFFAQKCVLQTFSHVWPGGTTARFFVRGAALAATLTFGLAAATAAAAPGREGMCRSKKAKLAAMCSQVAAW